MAKVFGLISQKINTKTVMPKVAITTPQLAPNMPMQITVAKLDIAIFTKLLPINIAATTLSNLVISRSAAFAPWTPWLTKCLALILFKEIRDVSERLKKKDNAANTIKIIKVGIDRKICILMIERGNKSFSDVKVDD